MNYLILSSHELKAQVSFSDGLLSVICLSVRLSVYPSVIFLHFQLHPPNHWANFKLGTKHPWVVCSNEGPRPFPRGDDIENVKLYLKYLKNLILKNYWANFNQTWYKASLSGGDSRL